VSFYITHSLELLFNYVLGKFEKVYRVVRKSLDIIGRYDISIKTSNERVWTLINVRHITALKKNLIFIRKLDDEGITLLV